MSMVATDIKGLLTIKFKPREDGYADQYSRMFMVKLLLACSLVTGLSWFGDSINCIVPETHNIDEAFVSSACWIQGVYIYRDLKDRFDDIGYYGISRDMSFDGLLPSGHLCPSKKKLDKAEQHVYKGCKEMTKTFYLQYQWMPFLIAAYCIIFYLPYPFYRKVNSDLISLKSSLKEDNPDAEKIAKYYFKANQGGGPNFLRMILNLVVKTLYIGSNVATFLSLNYLLNGDFYYYGKQWIGWAKLNNTMQHDYMGLRDFPKPGNEMLPPFGYCELYQSAKDRLSTIANKHKYICELSQNVLYQYCLIVLWFALILGIIVSVLGFLTLLFHYAVGINVVTRVKSRKKIYGIKFSARELEYLHVIKSVSSVTHGEVIQKIRENQHKN